MALIPFDFDGLTPEWRYKAEVEQGETPEKKAKALQEFKQMIDLQKGLKCRMDDIFLLRFIRLKKYDLDKALKLLLSYYNFKSKHVGVYNGVLPSDVKKVIEMNTLAYAPYRLPNGPHIAILRLGEFRYGEASAQDLIAAVLVMGEMMLDCEATQLFGGCLIVDMKHFTLQHYLQFVSFSVIAFSISVLQDCWPSKIDSIHIVNEPMWYRAVHRLLRPVMKKKTKERLHLHGDRIESLHKVVPRQYLPEDLGGSLGPLNYKEFLSYFLGKEPYIKMLAQYGYVDKKH